MKELVGKGKPFYSAVDKAAGLLKRKVGTGAEFMKELMALQGIKQNEIAERGLGELMGAPKMTHEQFMAALAAKPAPAIRENVLGEEPSPSDVRKQAIAMMKDMASEYASDATESSKEYRAIKADELRRMRKVGMMDTLLDSAKYDLYQEPHHEKYTLPGGKNYREMLIKAPEEGGEMFKGVTGHFNGEPGVLASMRLKDRTGPNGEKLLHLEELQSDWHQQGRDKGYKKTPEELQAERQLKQKAHDEYVKNESNALNEEYKALKEKMRNTPNVGTATPDQLHQLGLKLLAKTHIANFESPQDVADIKELQNQYDQLKEANDLKQRESNILRQLNILSESSPSEPENRGVPNAPFKKNWEEMALKRLIHHAAEKGYHGIVVTPGTEQADRYSLAKHIDDLHYSGTNLVAYDGEGNEVIKQTGVTPQELPSLIGKELAEKLMAQKPQGTLGDTVRSLRGVDMEVGGEGMKGFYDKKVPNILNSIGKKYGVKTELHAHPIPKGVSDFNPMTGETNPNQPQAQLHHFPITEEMRKDVLTNGLPLHREGGIIHKAVGGQVQPSINQMRAELMGKKPVSLSDLSTIGANEAPNMNVKAYVPPAMDGQNLPVGGVSMGNQPLPVGGIDMSRQAGQQLMPANLAQPPQGGQPPQAGGMPSPLSAGASSPAQQPPSNILQMTPQGQALNAMTPPQQPAKMADGGGIPMTYKVGGSDNMDMPDASWEPDDGEKTFNIDNIKLLASGGSVGDEDDSTVMTHDHGYADGGLVPEEMEPPKKTVKAYKLFRVHKKHPGKLFPLFVNADKPVEMDKWQQAEIGEMAGKKVKSKIGPLAFRPGWHAGDLPIATHIGEKDEEQKMEQARIRELRNKAVKKHGDKKLANQTYPYPEWTNAPRLRNPNHVWAEVDMPNDVNWQKEAEKRGMNAQGRLIAKNAHITDQIPHGGHYRYKTNSNMKGNWLIGGGMKVNRILSDDEVKAINKAAGAKDLPRAKKQKLADYGFKEGGSASPTQKSPDKFKPKATKASEALGKHEGKHLKVTQSDRTKVGGGFLGGPGFSGLQHIYPSHKDVAWGVNSSGAASKIANANAAHPEGNVLWSTLLGAPTQHTSNQMVFDMLMKQFKGGIKGGKLTPELRDRINAQLAMAVDSEGKPLFSNADIASKNFFKNLNTFDQRRVMADLMGGNKVGGKKGQIFDYGKTVESTTEPELLGAPTHAIGPRLFQLSGKRSVQPELNPAFPHMLHGEDLGQMFHPVPRQIMLPEFHGKIRQAKGRDVGFMDLTRNTPSQHLTEEFLTHLQKHGYKKGGKVKLSTNMDTINLELSRKSKKAK